MAAFYVLSIAWTSPRIGVANAVFCVLLGQIASAAVLRLGDFPEWDALTLGAFERLT